MLKNPYLYQIPLSLNITILDIMQMSCVYKSIFFNSSVINQNHTLLYMAGMCV